MTSNPHLEDLDPVLTEEEGNEVVFEMDLYAGGPTALGASSTNQGYVLQFPLRTVRNPYHDPARVKLKPKVKRMQWDIPLDRTKNYNDDAEQITKLRSYSLQSSRVDPGMQGLAIGIRQGNDVFLVPVSEVLQLRHSPAYLDVQKEGGAGGASGSGAGGRGGRGGGSAASNASDPTVDGDAIGSGSLAIKQEDTDLIPITVQVKKHETEQQTEARLRSYAFHAQQEEADPWTELKFLGSDTEQSQSILNKIPEVVRKGSSVVATHVRGSYLEAIAPGSTSTLENMHLGDDMNGDGTTGGGDLGRPAGHVGGGASGSGGAGTQISPDAMAALPTQLAAFFGADRVLSLESIRKMLINVPSSAVLNRAGESVSDAALHKAVMDSGNYICIRRVYTPRLVNIPDIDALRSIILELLQDKEQLKRSEITEVAKDRGLPVCTDAQYIKIIKLVCTSKGSNWVLKAGSGKDV